MRFLSPIIYFFLLLCVNSSLWAQLSEDELLDIVIGIEEATSGDKRRELLGDLTDGIRRTELKVAPILALRARQVIDRVGGDSATQAVAWGVLSTAHREVNQIDSAAYFMEKASRYMPPCILQECWNNFWTYGNLFIHYEDLAWYEKTLSLADSLLLLDSLDTESIVLSLDYSARAMTDLGAYDTAIGNLQRAMSFPMIYQSPINKSLISRRLSLLYQQMGNMEEREHWLQIAIAVERDQWTTVGLIPVDIEWSRLLFDQGETASAIDALQATLQVLDTLKLDPDQNVDARPVRESRLLALSVLVEGYTDNNLDATEELTDAVNELKYAIEQQGKYSDIKLRRDLLHALANYFAWQDQEIAGVAYAQAHLDHILTFNLDTSDYLVYALEQLHDIHARFNNTGLAYEALRSLGTVSEVLRNRREATEVAHASVSLRVDEYERARQAAEHATELEKENAATRARMFWIALLAASITLTALTWAYLRSRRDQGLISEQNILVNQSLSEKEVLLREIHHRVKNNLQIISSLLQKQAQQSDSQDLKDMIQDGQERIQSMALIHQNLYQSDQLGGVNIHEYLQDLAQSVEKSHGSTPGNINIELQVANEHLDIDTAIPLGLILNELITNAYKYAFPDGQVGKIIIEFNKVAEDFHLKVSDDGIGLPTDHDLRKNNSLGINLVNGLVRQLEGEIDWQSQGSGTTVVITF